MSDAGPITTLVHVLTGPVGVGLLVALLAMLAFLASLNGD